MVGAVVGTRHLRNVSRLKTNCVPNYAPFGAFFIDFAPDLGNNISYEKLHFGIFADYNNYNPVGGVISICGFGRTRYNQNNN